MAPPNEGGRPRPLYRLLRPGPTAENRRTRRLDPGPGPGSRSGTRLEGNAPMPSRGDSMPARTASVEDRLRKLLGDGLLVQEPLRLHTSFRIGGPADYFFAAGTPDAPVQALRAAHALDLPVFLLGGGSNPLVSDQGFRRLVVHNACEAIGFARTAGHVGGGGDFLQ